MPEIPTSDRYKAFIECPQLWLEDQAPFPLFEIPAENSYYSEYNSSAHLVFGKRMETFFSAAIGQSDRFEMIAENLQIISSKTTLGEIDFLLKDIVENQLLHVELACKFYLFDPQRTGNEFSQWVDPNQNDFLDQKIEKLKSKQLPLLYSDECRQVLTDYLNEDKFDTIIQKVCFPANLYVPNETKPEIRNVNPAAIAGTWASFQEFSKGDFSNFKFHLPLKQDWLLNPRHSKEWVHFDEALEQIRQLHLKKKSPLVWINNGNKTFKRMFVVWW